MYFTSLYTSVCTKAAENATNIQPEKLPTTVLHIDLKNLVQTAEQGAAFTQNIPYWRVASNSS